MRYDTRHSNLTVCASPLQTRLMNIRSWLHSGHTAFDPGFVDAQRKGQAMNFSWTCFSSECREHPMIHVLGDISCFKCPRPGSFLINATCVSIIKPDELILWCVKFLCDQHWRVIFAGKCLILYLCQHFLYQIMQGVCAMFPCFSNVVLKGGEIINFSCQNTDKN